MTGSIAVLIRFPSWTKNLSASEMGPTVNSTLLYRAAQGKMQDVSDIMYSKSVGGWKAW